MDAYLSRIRRLVEALLILTLSGMVLLTFIDVIGRRLFGAPLYGAHDATEHLMAIMVFCGLPLLTAARATSPSICSTSGCCVRAGRGGSAWCPRWWRWCCC